MKAKSFNCRYFKKTGNVFGGCSHTDATSACLDKYIDDCHRSERKYKTKKL
jgi:hypothetical protein